VEEAEVSFPPPPPPPGHTIFFSPARGAKLSTAVFTPVVVLDGENGERRKCSFPPPPPFGASISCYYRGDDKSLARPGRKQARKHIRDVRAISTTSRRVLSSSIFSLQGKTPKEIHYILTETLACFLPGRAKDLSASLYTVRLDFRSSGMLRSLDW